MSPFKWKWWLLAWSFDPMRSPYINMGPTHYQVLRRVWPFRRLWVQIAEIEHAGRYWQAVQDDGYPL